MFGAIIGDIIGSPYELGAPKTKDFELFLPSCHPTDDSILTIAVGSTCAEKGNCNNEDIFKETLINHMVELVSDNRDAGYGHKFYEWVISPDKKPYGGYTNGCVMRVSPVAWAATSRVKAERLAKWTAEITHDHPEGIKGAQAVAAAIYMARTGSSKEEIRDYITEKYYNLDFTLDEIREGYQFDMSCEGSVPQAIVCFLESTDFEDAIRNAISLGGDGDTQAAIAGSIAEAFYGEIPQDIMDAAFEIMEENLQEYIIEYILDYVERLKGE